MLAQGIQAERKERKLEQREHDEEVRTLGRERAAVLEQDRKVLLQRINHQEEVKGSSSDPKEAAAPPPNYPTARRLVRATR
eukprot:2984892-Pyramimonas_sp.AAC.2